MNSADSKKIYHKLSVLVDDCEKFVNSLLIVSNKEIESFVDASLQLIHKEFSLKSDFDAFLRKFNGIYLTYK